MKKEARTDKDRIQSGNLAALLVRSPRRSVSLQVNPDLTLVIKAPSDTPEPFLRDFLERKRPWVERNLERMARIRAAAPEWRDGGSIPFLGGVAKLRVLAGAKSQARFGADCIIAVARNPGDPEEVRVAVERLFVREALKFLPPMLDSCLGKTADRHFPRPRLKVRTMRSRWGSCDPRGLVITLNSRLLRFRPEVIESVMMHELAHLKYRSHGPRFYGLLESICPDYRELQRELADVYLD